MGTALVEAGTSMQRTGQRIAGHWVPSPPRFAQVGTRNVAIVNGGARIDPSTTIVGPVIVEDLSTLRENCSVRAETNGIVLSKDVDVGRNSLVIAALPYPQKAVPGIGHVLKIGQKTVIGNDCVVEFSSIGADCVVGDGAIVSFGSVLEDGAKIAPGSVVPSGTIVSAGASFP